MVLFLQTIKGKGSDGSPNLLTKSGIVFVRALESGSKDMLVVISNRNLSRIPRNGNLQPNPRQLVLKVRRVYPSLPTLSGIASLPLYSHNLRQCPSFVCSSLSLRAAVLCRSVFLSPALNLGQSCSLSCARA